MAETKIKPSIAIGVYAMYFMISGAGATTPAMAALQAQFAEQGIDAATITFINTLPSLTIIVGTLLMGAIAGKKISFKAGALVALVIYLIFGVLPVWVHDSFTTLLIIRVACGLGMGLVAPLGAAVFTNLVADKDQRSKFLGRGGALQQIGCVVMTFLGGWLAAVDVNYTWFAYLLCLPCILIVLFCYKETEATAIKKDVASEDKPKEKMHIGGLAWVFIIMFLIAQMVCSPTMMNFAFLIVANTGLDMGVAGGVTGTLLSVFVLAGAVGSALLEKFIKTTGKFTGLVMFIICAIGMLIVAKAGSIAMFTVGILIFGFGWCTAIPCGNLECASVTNKAGLAFVASLLWGLMNVGNFLSTYWLQVIYGIAGTPDLATGANLGNFGLPLIIGAVIFIVLGIIWAVVNLGSKTWKEGAPAEAE